MRRIVALVGGVALATAVLASPAVAAPSQRVSDTESILFCDNLSAEAGVAFAFAAESQSFGSFADLAFWAAPSSPETSEPTWITLTGTSDFSPGSVTARFDLVEFAPGENPEEPPFGDPVGTATLTGTLTPSGDPQPFHVNDRQGNHVYRADGVQQQFTVAGTLVLPTGIEFDLADCMAYTSTYEAFSNAPAASVSRFSDFNISCFWEVGDTFIGFFGSSSSFGTFADLFVSTPDAELFGVPTSMPTISTSGVAATFDLVDGTSGDFVGSAEASATLTRGARINERFRDGPYKVHVTGTSYVVDGALSVTVPGVTYDLPMDAESCSAADVRVTEQVSPRQGPRGRPLPNDAPAGALPIAIGDTVNVRTGGTAEEPEASCTAEFDGEAFDLPIGKTAWWTFEGTGGDVTVDTAGSDFDTIVGVYTNGSGLTQVGCVDDVDTLQARITISTDVGVTYYVQAGGFGGQSGTLVLSLN